MVKEKIVSDKKSLEGFDPIKFLKGRRRYLVGIVGAGFGYLISNNEIIAILSGAIVEAGVGLFEYYWNKYVEN